ncbi:MAG: hypothetical protein GY866_39450 [Proteobacteria bacterium]|nr:hypothetical protein [Pseudomonadota bacterium]
MGKPQSVGQYARSGNGLGVVVSSTGPGAALTVSPLREAFNSCSPVLGISSNIHSWLIGKGTGTLHEMRSLLTTIPSV